MAGSLLPVFVLVPWLGIQKTLLLASLLFAGMGILLILREPRSKRRLGAMAGLYATAAVVFVTSVPSDLCQRVFLALGFNLSGHTDILFYREGRTGTAIVTRDRLNQRKLVYVNGNP